MKPDYINNNPKKVSEADLKTALKKASVHHANYDGFTQTLQIILNTDNMSREEERELYQEVYVLYKEQYEEDVVNWAEQHFHASEVTKDSHPFWLDKRGLKLYRFMQSHH